MRPLRYLGACWYLKIIKFLNIFSSSSQSIIYSFLCLLNSAKSMSGVQRVCQECIERVKSTQSISGGQRACQEWSTKNAKSMNMEKTFLA